MPDPATRWLQLFTSNIRELYINDALDLMAAPAGFMPQHSGQ